ncbi:hypothetical protein V2J09_018998 [Rumex salicifolius]
MATRIVACFAVMALASYVAYATDPNQLQDFCVAIDNPTSGLFVNGQFCKNPNDVVADDFIFKGLNMAGALNKQGSSVNLVNVDKLKGLNTLGISIARIDYGPYGQNPPHTHPRATEILTVLEGTLYVGFVTSNLQGGGNKLFAKTLYKGDVFVFPQGLIHFQFNVGNTPAVAIAALSSQNPGAVTIANAVFGSKPPISVDVLTKAFQLNKDTVKYLQSSFGM